MLFANPATNKETIEQYQFNNTTKIGTITTELVMPSGWLLLWRGIIAFVVIIVSGIRIEGVIPKEYHKLK
jgi:hypothetical protein